MVVQCSGLTSKRLLKCDRVILSGRFDPLAVETPLPCKSSNIAIYILGGTRHRCHLPSPWSPIGRWQCSLWEPSPRENLPQFSILNLTAWEHSPWLPPCPGLSSPSSCFSPGPQTSGSSPPPSSSMRFLHSFKLKLKL